MSARARSRRVWLAAALVAALALGAPGRLLDKSGDKGSPSVFVTGGQQTPKGFVIRVRATPNERVEVRWDVSCGYGGKGRFDLGEFSMNGQAKHRIRKTRGKPDECIANALVSYDDPAIEGKIRVELFGRSR